MKVINFNVPSTQNILYYKKSCPIAVIENRSGIGFCYLDKNLVSTFNKELCYFRYTLPLTGNFAYEETRSYTSLMFRIGRLVGKEMKYRNIIGHIHYSDGQYMCFEADGNVYVANLELHNGCPFVMINTKTEKFILGNIFGITEA